MSDTDAAVDQTLVGIEQEADAVEIVTAVIGSSFRRRFTVQLVLADIAQSFRRRLVTNTASAEITTELRGFSQAARVRNVALGTHPLLPGRSGIDAPRDAHQPPISNAELEFFRARVYARGVDAMVPPPAIAAKNLTSDRLPKPRPVVKPFPQRGKPK